MKRIYVYKVENGEKKEEATLEYSKDMFEWLTKSYKNIDTNNNETHIVEVSNKIITRDFLKILEEEFELDTPSYRGGEYKEVREYAANSKNFADDLRPKEVDWYSKGDTFIINWVSQGETKESETLVNEITRVIKNFKKREGFEGKISLLLKLQQRGEETKYKSCTTI